MKEERISIKWGKSVMRQVYQWARAAGLAIVCIVSPDWVALAGDQNDFRIFGRDKPSAAKDRACSEVSEMQVCVVNRAVSKEYLPQIELTYRGYLQAAEFQNVVAFVKVNGKSGFFHMTKSSDENVSMLYLGRPTLEYKCRVGLVLDLEALPACPPGTAGSAGEVTWYFEGPQEAEQALFQNIRNDEGVPLIWNLEFAFVSVDGRHWDSKYGNNYRFSFAPPQGDPE